MTEIFQICYLFIIFCLLIFCPINVYKPKFISNNPSVEINIAYNILLNFNVLLLLSVLPISLSAYSKIFILFYFALFVYNYLLKISFVKHKFNELNEIIIFFIFFLIIAVHIASKLNLGWDAKWFWYIKSLFYYQNQTINELSNYTFNDFHPHLGSYFWAFFRSLSINEYEYTGRLFYAFLYLISILIITSNIFKQKINNLILFSLLITITYRYDYFSGLQEVLIFSLLLVVSKLMYDLYEFKDTKNILFILLGLNSILWIKSEGVAYALIIFVVINFYPKIKIKSKIIFSIIFFLLIILKILIYKYYQIKINDQPYYLNYILNLDLNLIIYKIKNIAIFLTYNSLKNIIFFITGILIIFNFNQLKKINYNFLIFICFILNIIFIFCAYLFRDMEIIYSLKTTMDRIVFSSSGLYLLYILKFFTDRKKSKF